MMQQSSTPRLYQNMAMSTNGNVGAAINTNGRYSPTQGYRNRLPTFLESGSIFSPFDDPFIQQARAAQAALAEMDVKNVNMSSMLRSTEMFSNYHMVAASTAGMEFDPMSLVPCSSSTMIDPSLQQATADSMASLMAMQHHYQQQQQQPNHFTSPYHHSMGPFGMPTVNGLNNSQIGSNNNNSNNNSMAAAAAAMLPMSNSLNSSGGGSTSGASTGPSGGGSNSNAGLSTLVPRYPTMMDVDTDPRELERFAEHFKQRRIKLGVTQADVGKALAHLKMPGVGSLSQSTICRFESLTLSHNNMVALKPILHSWLERAEDVIKNKDSTDMILPNTEKKRKRTSIAAPEKRLLEDYFRQQPRPTGDRISAIAEKLELKKNVVRVWFCNQRQKQKRSQFRSRNQSQQSQHSQQHLNSNNNHNSSSLPSAAAVAAALLANGVAHDHLRSSSSTRRLQQQQSHQSDFKRPPSVGNTNSSSSLSPSNSTDMSTSQQQQQDIKCRPEQQQQFSDLQQLSLSLQQDPIDQKLNSQLNLFYHCNNGQN